MTADSPTDAGVYGGSTEAPSRASRARFRRDVALEAGRELLEATKRGLWEALARPTASDVAMIACTLAVGLSIGSTLVGRELAGLAMGAGLAAALVTMLLASDRPLVRGLGGVLAVPVALLVSSPGVLAGALLFSSSGVGRFAGLTVWALVLAALAAGLLSWDRFGVGGVRRGATGAMLTAGGVFAILVLRVLPASTVRDRATAAVIDAGGATVEFLVGANGKWALVTFTGTLLIVAFAWRRTLAYLPLERLVPPDRRDRLATGVARGRWLCSLTIRVSIGLTIATLAAPSVADGIDSTPVTPVDLRTTLPAPLGDVLAWVVTVSGLRIALLSMLALALSLALLEWIRRALGKNVARVLARLAAPAVGGALVALGLAAALAETALEADLEGLLEGAAPPSVVELIGSFPAFALAATVLLVTLGVLSSLLWSVTLLRAIRLLPKRATGAALAAGSVFLLAIGLAVVGRVEPAILTAAGAFVVWDIGEYATGVRTELGRKAATLRAELVHVGGSLLTGAVVAGGTVGCYRWIATSAAVTDPAVAAVVAGTGLLAVVLVAWALRG